jgi:hypothetical protein
MMPWDMLVTMESNTDTKGDSSAIGIAVVLVAWFAVSLGWLLVTTRKAFAPGAFRGHWGLFLMDFMFFLPVVGLL